MDDDRYNRHLYANDTLDGDDLNDDGDNAGLGETAYALCVRDLVCDSVNTRYDVIDCEDDDDDCDDIRANDDADCDIKRLSYSDDLNDDSDDDGFFEDDLIRNTYGDLNVIGSDLGDQDSVVDCKSSVPLAVINGDLV